ncbi:hypothetical protein [Crocinitomix algicola]|uniref:hypothetical protein n=1 Tax=Crocinitomix algicola TaxID=1740263 RepID=UPI001586F5D2|nr:hypothetical protein [Crocinitomix algicola]
MIFLVFFHLALTGLIFILLYRSFKTDYRLQNSFQGYYTLFEILINGLFILGFFFSSIIKLNDLEHFKIFLLLSVITNISYLMSKTNLKKFIKLHFVFLVLMGTLFWCSLLMAYKLVFLLKFGVLPFFGLLILTPIIFVLLTASEIRFQLRLQPGNNFIQIIALGLLPLIIIDLIVRNQHAFKTSFFDFFTPIQF